MMRTDCRLAISQCDGWVMQTPLRSQTLLRRQTLLRKQTPSGHVTSDACWEEADPTCRQNDRQLQKTLPSPLCYTLWSVTRKHSSRMSAISSPTA